MSHISTVRKLEDCRCSRLSSGVTHWPKFLKCVLLVIQYFRIFDCELALAVLYVCFCLLVIVVLPLPFLNFQAQIENIFFSLIEKSFFFSLEFFPFSNWNLFLFPIRVFSLFKLEYFLFSNWNDFQLFPFSKWNVYLSNWIFFSFF